MHTYAKKLMVECLVSADGAPRERQRARSQFSAGSKLRSKRKGKAVNMCVQWEIITNKINKCILVPTVPKPKLRLPSVKEAICKATWDARDGVDTAPP